MQETIRKLATELGLPQEVIVKAYKAYWAYIRHTTLPSSRQPT